MQFEVFFDDEHHIVEVDPEDVRDGQPMFDTMDRDMDGGWRMGPEYVHDPDIMQRVQIVSERLMLAIEGNNEALTRATAAYIAWRAPTVRAIRIDTTGEPQLTEIIT